MRLTSLHEDYWQPIADHPGQLGKKDKRAKKNDKSFLVHPEDRKRWLKWFSGGKKIKEDLDDKDEFGEFELRELTTPDEVSQVLTAQTKNYYQLPFLQRMLKESPVYLISKTGEPYALLTNHLRNTEGNALRRISGPLARFLVNKIGTGEIRGPAVEYVNDLIERSRRTAQPTPQVESSQRFTEGIDDMFAGRLDDKDEFGLFQRQEIANNIKKLRYIAASSDNPKHRQNAATLAKSMEKLYAMEFGEPYNPTA